MLEGVPLLPGLMRPSLLMQLAVSSLMGLQLMTHGLMRPRVRCRHQGGSRLPGISS